MANVSDAWGTIRIKPAGRTKEEIDSFIKDLNETTSNWYYGTHFEESIDDFLYEFRGDGRWTYSQNIDWIFNSEHELFDERAKEIYEKHKLAGVEMEIEYTEIETGNFFIKEDEEVSVKIGDDNLPKITGCLQGTEYDPTVEDIVRLLNYTKREAEEYLGIY